ncbi:MAG TPA: 50S ribosomal protein L25/general stress protein Ctc [Rhodobacteraceae bacterium]|nr:50S ribosomal protein L25/general stress protein Ctc [Paracoccaceae bacterium]
MAENTTLNATARAGTGKGAARAARRENLVPGIVYGGGAEPTAINMKFNELFKMLKAGGFLSTLLTLKLDGKDERVICRGVQRDVVKDLPIHVDFLRLSAKSRINLMIPVQFLNEEESAGLKKGGTLVVVRNEVELKVTAGNIPDHLEVDLLEVEIGDTIHMSGITLPEGTRPMITDRDFVIANIGAPKTVDLDDEDEDATEGEAAPEAEEGAAEE